jgi:CheY-like chemotaxis protein
MAPAQKDATYLDRARGDGVRVLLAEDDAAPRQLFAALLRNANGVSMVVEGEDGASAVARALHTHPHAAVFDNHMPRLSGIDAALQLRKLRPALRSNCAMRA